MHFPHLSWAPVCQCSGGKVESSIVVVVSTRDHGSVLDRRDLSPSEENVNVGKQLITYYVIAQARALFLSLSVSSMKVPGAAGSPDTWWAVDGRAVGEGPEDSCLCSGESRLRDDTVTWICFTGHSCCHRPQTGREGGLGDASLASWHRASGSEAH